MLKPLPLQLGQISPLFILFYFILVIRGIYNHNMGCLLRCIPRAVSTGYHCSATDAGDMVWVELHYGGRGHGL